MLQRIGGVLAVVATVVVLWSPGTAAAVVPGGDAAVDDADLVVTASALVRDQPRRHVTTTTSRPLRERAWQQFVARGGTWQASWDAATKVPSRIWGSGIAAPGSSASADVAAAWARAVLAAHLDLLAPGAAIADFVVVSNQLAGDVRVVGLAQRHGGLRVIGGQVSFRFKNDRLFVIGSEALPDVRVAAPRRAGSAAQRSALAVRARDATVRDLGLAAATVVSSGAPAILPLVGDSAVLGFRVVTPVDVDGGAAGRWTVYAGDDGEPVARAPLRQYATGTLYYDAITRYPGTPRFKVPARKARITVNGLAMTADADGVVTWSPDATAAVLTTATGETVAVVNKSGVAAGAELTLAPGSETLWTDESALVDAQIQGFVHTLIAKDYVRSHLADLEFLAQPLVVNVNLDDECNAYYDGESINFFRSSDRCQNTALLADVIYHEFGHALHHAALVEGVGRMDGALSEGMADFLAASITDDPGMGRGFFRDDEALRHIDEPTTEAIWPRDIGEIHTTGIIFAGTMWDLRKAFIAELGDEAGVALVNRLYLAAIRTSTNIPSTLIEILAADDDDGDLTNGTPHECTIKSVFMKHGMHTTTGVIDTVGAISGTPATTVPVRLEVAGLSASCPDDQITGVTLHWRPREASSIEPGTSTMTFADGAWTGQVVLPPESNVLLYRVGVHLAGGTEVSFPDNRGYPYYELYNGELTELYCTDFEVDPFTQGWTHGGDPVEADIWQWGPPGGGAAGDPATALSGTSIIGTNLRDRDGTYGWEGLPWSMWMRLPTIDVGQWSDVRIQFGRWLTVEDAYFDQAKVMVDGELAWQNFNSNLGDSSSTHHQDLQWVFADIPVTPHIRDRFADIEFRIDTDRGLAFGGWNIDDLCIVANVHSVCGDGQITGGEQCDDGAANADVADACRSICRAPDCGDGILDRSEQCDDGNRLGGDTCTPRCVHSDFEDHCECSSRRPHPGALIPLGLAVLFLLRRRRPRALP
jgi:cysteine-rich repeat protein